MTEVRWGIAGPGRIARNVAADFGNVTDGRLVAVGSRSTTRAQAFADEFGIARAHGSYRALIDDPEVDALYIATPHPQHMALALAAIEAGKHLLIEKSFTATVAGAERILAAAGERGTFVMEAMWTRFQPAIIAARDVIASGEVGEIRVVQADLAAYRDFDPDDRLFNPALGGGAVLDLGVYVISLAQHFLGDPDEVIATGTLLPNGMDASVSIITRHDAGRTASLLGSLECHGPGRAALLGTKGWIDIPPRFHHPSRIVVHIGKESTREIDAPARGAGYNHEFSAASADILAGRQENQFMPWRDTLSVMRTMEDALDQLGIHHTEDTSLDLS